MNPKQALEFRQSVELSSARLAMMKAAMQSLSCLKQRPPKALPEKYKAISIRLHPKVIAWAKREAKKRRVGYQTIIDEYLLKKVA